MFLWLVLTLPWFLFHQKTWLELPNVKLLLLQVEGFHPQPNEGMLLDSLAFSLWSKFELGQTFGLDFELGWALE